MGHGRNPQRVLLAALLLVASPARASASWRTSWAAAPAPSMAAAPGVPPEGVSPIFDNQTVVQTVRLSAGGVRLRLRLSNAYGAVPLTVGHVTIALVGPDGRARGGGREVTFGGASGVRIPPHAPALSDPVDLATGSFGRVQVSLYLPEDVERCTCHAVGLQAAQISPTGDYTDRAFTPVSTTQARAFFSAVEVESSAPAPVIVTLGDSITDGWRSTAGADRRWTDRLAERLAAAGHPAFVANEGLSGNRLLSDGAIPIFGESALTRFDRDVLAQPGATHLVVLEGVNDLGGSPSPSADAMIAGYRQLMARARDHGLRVILGTILPYEGARYFRSEGEAVRSAVNAWIRTNREADGVIDFDQALRDPADPARMRAALQSGDWLHPNDAGYRAMGDAVPLGLFR